MATTLPPLPVPLAELPDYIAQRPDQSVDELVAPYREYEARLRELFAREPDHELLRDPLVNVLPLFDGKKDKTTGRLAIRARIPAAESEAERSQYLMPLPDLLRRPTGAPATVGSLAAFRRSFSVFSESSLADLDWSNVVVAGSAVVNCLLPVPPDAAGSRRSLRRFYHERLCPASDVDLFLYGLSEAEAVDKIRSIEAQVRDSVLSDTTTVRTKHAITICSQYPVRHVQIVLRIYRSVSEILTGFDVDCSGAAFDGQRVYCTPRALQAFLTQANRVDLSRRSPSYENRLHKFARRGFEVYWPPLDRDRIDPTIFERSFPRTRGLARLLVLERLPTTADRDGYRRQRREERGRPVVLSPNTFRSSSMSGNIKDEYEDEVAEWVADDEDRGENLSNYHTFTLPYGPRFGPRRIEKLCYTRDLLLNAEWNQPDDRRVYLHRHPAFFGHFDDVVGDCCGCCPTPVTAEEREVAEVEAKTFVSGRLSFITDDPGRQQIGSFHPLTSDDWTDMAYVADTARLSQAIADGDLAAVQSCLTSSDGTSDLANTRDYTGRTPLHLAVVCSTPAIVGCLVDAGARLVARLADGRMALHLAAQRGDADIVQILMDKSAANEAAEDEKREKRPSAGSEDSDSEMVSVSGEDEQETESVGAFTGTTSSFVKVAKGDAPRDADDDVVAPDEENEPDFYDVNVLAWDVHCSPLHLAILSGHMEVVKLLCQEYGADVLLPVKLFDSQREPQASLLTLSLALALPSERAASLMAETLLGLGATWRQADLAGVTALHRYALYGGSSDMVLCEADASGAAAALQSVAFAAAARDDEYYYFPAGCAEGPLHAAVKSANVDVARRLLLAGAAPNLDFPTWLRSAQQLIPGRLGTFDTNMSYFRDTRQPLQLAVQSLDPSVAIDLVARGADVNAINADGHSRLRDAWAAGPGQTVLDEVRAALDVLRRTEDVPKPPSRPARNLDSYVRRFESGSYQAWIVSRDADRILREYEEEADKYRRETDRHEQAPGVREKKKAIDNVISQMEGIERVLLGAGAKTFGELYPGVESEKSSTAPSVSNQEADDYEFSFTFVNAPDVTEARQEAYIQLFDAAWKGDLDKIKRLTLTSWDAQGAEAPLKLAVRDGAGNNPFSLALLRGHAEVAGQILAIVQSQYTPEEQPKARYTIQTRTDASDEDDKSSDLDPEFRREAVHSQFTTENVGQVSMRVTSHTTALEVLSWPCDAIQGEARAAHILEHCVRNGGLDILSFVLDVANHFLRSNKQEAAGFYRFPDAAFKLAVDTGRTELLPEMIERTGAGLPLERLVRETGVEFKEETPYYRGLTVRGKKKADWAAYGRRSVTSAYGSHLSPLILAALAGCAASVKWFLGDAPRQHYAKFAASKKDDARLRHLADSAAGGVLGAISEWLDGQKDLVVHAAILARPCSETDQLVAQLVEWLPNLVEAKDGARETPLFLAAYLGRAGIAKVLVDAGADQECRDGRGNNLLHAALARYPFANDLGAFLDIFDRDVLQHLSGERNSLAHGGRTPLHAFLHDYVTAEAAGYRRYKHTQQAVDVIQMMARLFGSGQLDVLDGSGNTALHGLVTRQADPTIVRAVLEAAGDDAASHLAHENVVGLTPLEVAQDQHISRQVASPNVRRLFGPPSDNQRALTSLVHYSPESFLHGTGALAAAAAERCRGTSISECVEPDSWLRTEEMSVAMSIWRLCVERGAGKRGKKARRKLVNLHEANDVARRLGEKHAGSRYGYATAGNGGARDAARDSDVVGKYRYDLPYAPWGREPEEGVNVALIFG